MSSRQQLEPIYNSLSLTIPTIIILTTTIFHTLFAYYQQRTKSTKSLIFTALLSTSIFLIWTLILLYIAIREITNTLTSSDCVLHFVKNALMIVGKIFMYLLFIGRLYYVFRGSLFSFDRKQIILYQSLTFILLFIPALLALTSAILPSHAAIHNEYHIHTIYDCSAIFAEHWTPETKIMFIAGISMFTLFDIIIAICILRAFVSRLLWIYTWCAKGENTTDISFLLQTAMKVFNLTAAAITTSWLGIVFQGTGYGSHWLCIDVVVNVLAMYLSFSFTTNIYSKLSVCCCTNCCFVGWKTLCFCCCLKYELPKDIEMNTHKHKSKKSVPDTSIAISVDKSSKTQNGENTLNNDMKVILHDWDDTNNKKPTLAAKLSNLSNNIHNKIQKKRSEKLLSDKQGVSHLSLQFAQSEPVPKVKPAMIVLQNHFSNKIM